MSPHDDPPARQQLGLGWGKGPVVITRTRERQQRWERHVDEIVDAGAPTAPDSMRPPEKRQMAKARLRRRRR
jgi:hypothetical protein